MASALSATVWRASSTSVLVTERMASRSLTSDRPMSSSVDDMGRWLLCDGDLAGSGWIRRVRGGSGRDEVGDEPGQHEGGHEPVGHHGIGQVVAVGFEAVADDRADDPLGRLAGGLRGEEA